MNRGKSRPERRQTAVEVVGSAGIGFAEAIAIYYHFLQAALPGPLLRWPAIVSIATLLAVATWCLLFRGVVPRMAERFTSHGRFVWVVTCLAASVLLFVVIPIPRPPPGLQHHRLEIAATGQKNPASTSAGVELVDMRDQAVLWSALHRRFEAQGDWVRDKTVIGTVARQPSTLVWDGSSQGAVVLRLSTGPWAGIVRLTWDGQSQEIDLYSPRGDCRPVMLPSVGVRPFVVEGVFFLFEVLGLAAVSAVVSGWFLTRPLSEVRTRDMGRGMWLGYSACCAAYWSYHLWVFRPGLMSMDSVTQLCQVRLGQLDDVMPFCHTAFVWLLTLLWPSPAMIAIVQILLLAAVVGWMLFRWNQWGMPLYATWAACIVFAVAPATGNLVITLWKDIPYSTAELVLTQCVLEIVVSEGQWIARKRNLALMMAACLVIALFRHNGPPVPFLTLLLLPLAYHAYWRRLAVAWLAVVAVWFGVTHPLARALEVTPAPEALALMPILHQVAAHTAHGDQVTDADRAVLSKIHPLDNGHWPYDPYNLMTLTLDGRFDFAQLHEQKAELVRIYLALARKQPSINLRHMAESSSFIWRVREPKGFYDSGCVYVWEGKIFGPDLANLDPLHPRLDLAPQRPKPAWMPLGVVESKLPSWSWLLRRPAIFMYGLLFAAAVAVARSGTWRYLLALAPIAIQTLTLIPICATSEFRYQWGVYLLGILMTPLLAAFAPRPGRAEMEQESRSDQTDREPEFALLRAAA